MRGLSQWEPFSVKPSGANYSPEWDSVKSLELNTGTESLLSRPHSSKVLEPSLAQAEASERSGGIHGEGVNPYCSWAIYPQILIREIPGS